MLFIPGIGFATIDGPTFYLLVQYFDRRRELANSVLVSFVSFGELVLPPLYRYLLDVYGLRGTMLIVSGLMYSVVALARLLKPSSFFRTLSESNVVQIAETYKYSPVPTSKKPSSSLSQGMLPGNGVSTFTEKEATWVSMPDRLNAVRERNGLGLSQSMQNLGSTNAVFSLSQTQLEEVKSNNENIIDISLISEVVSLCLLIGKYRICVWSHFYIPICS